MRTVKGCGRCGCGASWGSRAWRTGLVAGGAGRNRQLERIAALVDWAAFERLLCEVYAAPVGRPIGPIRAPVERTFAILKRWYRYRRVRYRSLINKALQLQLLAVALNLRRALVLTG
jgi:transposase